MRAIILRAAVLGFACSPAAAADWPQFRGPNGSAVSSETGLPVGFTEKEGLRWKVETPGRGVSSPVVVGGKVFVTSTSGPNGDRLHVVAYDAGTGAKLWHRQFAATGPTFCHPDTCLAAPTPVGSRRTNLPSARPRVFLHRAWRMVSATQRALVALSLRSPAGGRLRQPGRQE